MPFKRFFILFGILVFSMSNTHVSEEADLILARVYFEKIGVQETAVKNLKILTETKKDKPIYKAYLGAAYCAEAKYKWNPYTKLDKVKVGMNLLNEAVTADYNNIEIRFLRFCIEENIPNSLPYRQHLEIDKNFLILNLKKDHGYYTTMKNYLLQSKLISESDKKKI